MIQRFTNPVKMKKLRTQKAAVMMEAVLLIPLLIILTLLLTDSGRAIGNLLWISRIPYTVGSAGAESTKEDYLTRMGTRYNLVSYLLNTKWRRNPVTINAIPTPNVLNAPAGISANLAGDTRFAIESKVPISMPLFAISGLFNLSPSATLPILAKQKNNPNNLAMFENKMSGSSEVLYNCAGDASGSSASCITCTDPNLPSTCRWP
jgi:hypothetical protein